MHVQLSSGAKGIHFVLNLIYAHIMRVAKALARLCVCAGSSKTSLLAYSISTKTACVDSFKETRSVTMNIFRNFRFKSFVKKIKLCFHNRYFQYS